MRSATVDKVRGAAILVMMLDHLLLFIDPTSPIRYTFTRLAMPLFFIVSGQLLRRLNYSRLGIVAAIGILLPSYAHFIDSPNVLLIYAISAIILIKLPYPKTIIAIALAFYANRYTAVIGTSYQPLALLAFMALGRTFPVAEWRGDWIPGWVAFLGKRPLEWYVGHIVVFETVYRLVGM